MMFIDSDHSDLAESANSPPETLGDGVVRTVPCFLHKYHRVEKMAEGKSIADALLLAERLSGTSAFAHSLAYCQAIEKISDIEVPRRAMALRIMLAELERLRRHVSSIGRICASTAMTVATGQANVLEEALLRLSCTLTGHRYLFGLNTPGGLTMDFAGETILQKVCGLVYDVCKDLKKLKIRLKFARNFPDRLQGVGIVTAAQAAACGLRGPVARASGVEGDLRKSLPYSGYEKIEFIVPREMGGDSHARLNVLFDEAEQSADIIQDVAMSLPSAPIVCAPLKTVSGSSAGWAEAPEGAVSHWLKCGEDGRVLRYRLGVPSFANWKGFHLAAKDSGVQDLPIVLATFGLSDAESDCWERAS